MDLSKLKDIAIMAALSAGDIIRKYMDEDVTIELKGAGGSYASQVVTAVDKACEVAILDYLLPSCEKYNLALISEETNDDGSRFNKAYFWCIDPMDGTLAFINRYPGFSVSIALVAKDGTPIIGVVYDPSKNTLYHAIKGRGAFKNNSPWVIEKKNKHLSYVTDRPLKDTPHSATIEGLLNEHKEKLGLSGVKEIAGAGAVLNALLVVENSPACMLKLPKKETGGGCIWDFAATACIFEELVLHAKNYKGDRLDLNKKNGAFMNLEGVFYAAF